MEHLLEHVELLQDHEWLRGYTWGIIHSFIIIVGYYTGFSFYRFFKFLSNGYVCGILGAIIAHVFADLLASLADPHMRASTFGIVTGGLIPIMFIPLLEKFVTKNKKHILVGDHEDVKRDLKAKHR